MPHVLDDAAISLSLRRSTSFALIIETYILDDAAISLSLRRMLLAALVLAGCARRRCDFLELEAVRIRTVIVKPLKPRRRCDFLELEAVDHA